MWIRLGALILDSLVLLLLLNVWFRLGFALEISDTRWTLFIVSYLEYRVRRTNCHARVLLCLEPLFGPAASYVSCECAAYTSR